jgi:hypothetical protein
LVRSLGRILPQWYFDTSLQSEDDQSPPDLFN